MGELLPLSVLRSLWPHGNQHVLGLVEGIAASAPAVFERHGITSTLEVTHIMGEFSEECGAGLELTENLNYSASGLLREWPRHFTGTMAYRYQHNPRMIADVAYGGRMGNSRPPSDDGWNYRGKGLSQLTGKENYQRLATITGLDVVANPDLLIQPETALECAVADFVRICGCLPYARRDDLRGVCFHLNGGYNGLAERAHWTNRWKVALRPYTVMGSPAVKPEAPPQSVQGGAMTATSPPSAHPGPSATFQQAPPPTNHASIMTSLADLRTKIEDFLRANA
jgi:putative chitinase